MASIRARMSSSSRCRSGRSVDPLEYPPSRMVKKLRLLKGGSVPTFLVLGRCCTTSLPWTLEEGRRGSQAILGYRRLVKQFQCSMAVLELLSRATEAWVVAAGNEHLVNRSSRIVDGVSRRC